MTTAHADPNILVPTIAVVRVYGIKVGHRPEKEWTEYAAKVMADFPAVRYGRFGKRHDNQVIIYLADSFTEMYDNGVGTSESMICSENQLDFNGQWDDRVVDCVEALGYVTYDQWDVRWYIGVIEFQ